MKQNKCVLCGKLFSEYGNNPMPLAKGLCCDECNEKKVLPERRKVYSNKSTQYIRTAKKFGSGCHIVLPLNLLEKELLIMENKK